MRNLLAALTTGFFALAPAQIAHADVVVELYTSQGCSSCPPADALLGELSDVEGVIALSLHVDYWDYLGWTDEFASPAFTKRQRSYASRWDSSMIYTPQMVIAGRDQIVGTKAMKLSDAIAKHKAIPAPVALDAMRSGPSVSVRAPALEGAATPMAIYLVQYTRSQTVEIKRGENAGRQLTYHNVVSSWGLLGEWDGAAPLFIEAELPADTPAVVIVQEGRVGPILAAKKLD